MKKTALALLAPLIVAAAPAPPPVPNAPAAAPSEIVSAAPHTDWTAIAPADLLVMDLAPDARGHARRVVIQLMPAPFSQGWIGNIRKLAAAHWWDGTSVNRVQDNYVVQWGDAEAEDKAKAKALPAGLKAIPGSEYAASDSQIFGKSDTIATPLNVGAANDAAIAAANAAAATDRKPIDDTPPDMGSLPWQARDPYADSVQFQHGWPIASGLMGVPFLGRPKDLIGVRHWPLHCYGMVGVGRNMPPDTGSGAELYAVIGTPPRHLDRNIALVGRVIEGIEHLSSLPRGTGPLGFYETSPERTVITSIRLGPEVPGLPAYQYLNTESASFARYADARANRRDAFFIRPAGGADICNIPVPVRRAK